MGYGQRVQLSSKGELSLLRGVRTGFEPCRGLPSWMKRPGREPDNSHSRSFHRLYTDYTRLHSPWIRGVLVGWLDMWRLTFLLWCLAALGYVKEGVLVPKILLGVPAVILPSYSFVKTVQTVAACCLSWIVDSDIYSWTIQTECIVAFP
jgi:hypothetical protein